MLNFVQNEMLDTGPTRRAAMSVVNSRLEKLRVAAIQHPDHRDTGFGVASEGTSLTNTLQYSYDMASALPLPGKPAWEVFRNATRSINLELTTACNEKEEHSTSRQSKLPASSNPHPLPIHCFSVGFTNCDEGGAVPPSDMQHPTQLSSDENISHSHVVSPAEGTPSKFRRTQALSEPIRNIRQRSEAGRHSANPALAEKDPESSWNGMKFMCPFFRKSPERYVDERSCRGPGWSTIHRLK